MEDGVDAGGRCQVVDANSRPLGTHPTYQINGNFGATAGIADMLLQSRLGTIDVLPALPSTWEDGGVDGLKARGAFTLGATWHSGNPTAIRLASAKGGDAVLRHEAFRGEARLYRANGRPPTSPLSATP